jgi:nitrite reductase/ring-hydroxylating ferredoxin subunit
MSEILVCREGDLDDGAVMVVAAGTIEIGVIRHKGQYYAYRNRCPHQGGPVCEGVRLPQVKDLIGEGGIYLGQAYDEDDLHIVCPWHAYEFHLSNGCHVVDQKVRLKKYEVIKRDGTIYVAV